MFLEKAKQKMVEILKKNKGIKLKKLNAFKTFFSIYRSASVTAKTYETLNAYQIRYV